MRWKLVFFLLLIPHSLFSSSYFLYNQDATVNARGLTGVSKKGPQSIFYNPASIREGLIAGFSFFHPRLEFKGMGIREESRNEDTLLPYFYFAKNIGSYNIGIGFNSPYGLLTKWSDDWIGRNLSTKGLLKTQFLYLGISRSFGFLSIGVSPFFVKTYIEMRGAAPNGSKMKLDGDENRFGFKIGGFLEKGSISLGLTYQNSVILGNLDGDLKINGVRVSSSRTRLILPGYLSLGFSYKFSRLILSFEILRMFWGDLDEIKVGFENRAFSPMVSTKKGRDTNLISFGFEYNFGNLSLLGGISFDESPFPEKYTDPLLPDNDRILYTLGFMYSGKKWGLSFAYQKTVFHRAHAELLLPGVYRMSADVYLLCLRLR